MKWFVYILSFYVLLLSAVPCCADDDCCANEQNTSVQTNHSKETSKPSAPCSPFFACAACNGVIIPQVFRFSVVEQHEVVVYKFFYHDNLVSRNLPSIWQPPKC
ncbi:DUF6660 family protein [Pinibacter soli]|uniref:Secreted protein n=1 Tax=Pinibacter soli TaxID=3044211 RepID=A0ABT6RAV6_9BACT|nr:DUF6660 family protein [Pinibacter soli]MDI3319702.1 hypothetical protein [Pinibacter soli]